MYFVKSIFLFITRGVQLDKKVHPHAFDLMIGQNTIHDDDMTMTWRWQKVMNIEDHVIMGQR